MPKHKHFEELAAIAALGELSPSQLGELNVHLAACAQCKQISKQYDDLNTARPALDKDKLMLIESRRDKVKAAVMEEISTQNALIQSSAFPSKQLNDTSRRWAFMWPVGGSLALATALIFVFVLGVRFERAVMYHKMRTSGPPEAVTQPNALPMVSANSGAQGPPAVIQYDSLMNDLRAEQQRSEKLQTALTVTEGRLKDSINEKTAIEQQVASLTTEVQQTQSFLTVKSEQLQQMVASKSSDFTELVALQYQVQDLTKKLDDQKQSLDNERQLLTNGRDIRDIIGARNLHIIDVYDTESEGKTSKSFARAFYTEGKSLIFYAYDLPARKTEDGKFVYTAWGQSNGNKSQVQRLGILLNDDKGQKRWALSFSDPKILTEIDSVFVTLERTKSDTEQPSGQRMLTAYLNSQVNHP